MVVLGLNEGKAEALQERGWACRSRCTNFFCCCDVICCGCGLCGICLAFLPEIYCLLKVLSLKTVWEGS